MILRPRQTTFVKKCLAALREHANTLGVAPTGSGKTVILSKLVGDVLGNGGERALIIQHRDELTRQNRGIFHKVNPDIKSSGLINADTKEFSSPVAFGMVPTLARNLQYLQPVDLVVVDEAHHTAAASYNNVLARLRELNPDTLIAGFTATPRRGDKAALLKWFDNVADHITLSEMIASGVLVKPRPFVIDLGVRKELEAVRETISDFDMSEVSKIMDHGPLNRQVVEHWKKHAGDRQTVVFCSTVEHAHHVCGEFASAGVYARVVWGDMPKDERRETLADFDKCDFQVVVTVAVLTEGWDCQPVSCVVLLRPCSYKSTMIQMIGRGLRRLDPELYPTRRKVDCIVLDFGTSYLTHGGLEAPGSLAEEKDAEEEEDQPKFITCPACKTIIPGSTTECPVCGHNFVEEYESPPDLTGVELPGKTVIDFEMRELGILQASPFRWETFQDGVVMIANGFNAFGITIWYQGEWHGVGAVKGGPLRHLSRGDKLICLSIADDFIRTYEEEGTAHKSRRWLHLQPTDNQLRHLGCERTEAYDMNRYQAACLLTWKFNSPRIRAALEIAHGVAA